MHIGTTVIEETFAEAFRMHYARLIVTALDEHWLQAAVQEATGNASSVIGCDTEAGLECWLSAKDTPDGRPGAALMFFGFSPDSLAKSVPHRTGQNIMTCPTTAVFDGLPRAETRIALGANLRFFGDGYQKSKRLEGKRFWRVPVMDGEFLVAHKIGAAKGIGGGNLILLGSSQHTALSAARRAVQAISQMPGVILPFPGGVVRSGSKVGSKYKKLPASTNDAYCPTLRGLVQVQMPDASACAYEIVIDGIDEPSIAAAMKAGMQAAAGPGLLKITAGNYGGSLGKFHFKLHEILGGQAAVG